MYKKTFATTLVSLVLLLFGSFIANAQTYSRCDDVYEYVYAYAVADDNQQREETFTLDVGRNVTISYGFDSEIDAKGHATVCLYYAGGGLTPFGCESYLGDATGSTVLYLPAGSYRMTAGAVSVNPHGEGGDMVSGWLLITSGKITPTSFNVTGGGTGCDGGNASFPIGLDGSESGVTYQLSRDNVPVATVTSGGGAFSFGNFQTPGTYTVATISPCPVVGMNSGAVITDPRPSSFTAWNDGPKCGTNPAPVVTLSATNIPGATYHWVGPYGAFQTTSTSWTTINGLVGTFDYSVYATINGCTTSTAVTPVTIYPPAPSTSAGSPQTLCAMSTLLSANPPGAGFSGRWEQVGGPGTAQTQFVDRNAYNTQVSVITPGTYTYEWTVSGASVCAPSTARVSITFNIKPDVRSVSVNNNGQRCSNETPLTISLAASQLNINYQLKINGANSGGVLAGTGGTLTWADQGTGSYSIQAIGTGGCTETMNIPPSITVNTAPAVRAVSGSATVCAGTPVSVTLPNSELPVTYQLLKNGTPAGVGDLTGTGGTLTWPVQAPGTYTVRATRGTCVQLMGGNATITINPVPQAYTLNGGGTQCFGGTGFAITLADSEVGVSYQLKINGQNTGAPVAGTDGSLTWASQNTNGTYTVVATHNTGGCTQVMTGNPVIIINPLPTMYTIGGGGAVCTGSQFAITLSDSEVGVNYQLKRGTTNISTLAGTDGPLSWGNQVLPGAYTITATNVTTTCTRSMGTATVTLNAVPSVYSVSGGGERCDDKPGLTVSINGSQAPQGGNVVQYQLKRDNIDLGQPVTGTGSALNWGNLTETGTYTVQAIHNNGCTRMMTSPGPITINTKAAPTIANAGADMNVCGLQVDLLANTPTIGTGSWVQVSGPVTSDIHSPLSPSTTVDVTQPDTYVYAWTITNGNGCVSADSVRVIYNATVTQADAGEPQNICNGDMFAFMAANPDTDLTGNGEWIQISGPPGGVFYPDANTKDAILFVSEAGTYAYQWKITNPPCEASIDTVQINFGVAEVPFTVTKTQNGSEMQYRIAEAVADAAWRNAHTYQWLYIDNNDVQTDVTNTSASWQTQIRVFPDFLSGTVTDASLVVDVYSNGCLTRQVYGKELDGGTLRKQQQPATLAETPQQAGEGIQVYPVPASQSLTVQIPFDGTWKAELRSMNGTLIKTGVSNEKTSTLDVSEVPAGLYLLYVQSNGKRVIRKVEVVR